MDVDSSTASKPTSGAGLLTAAAVLIGLGLVGIVLYAVGAPDQLAEGSALGGLRGALIIVSALCVGAGGVLALVAVNRRRRKSRVEQGR